MLAETGATVVMVEHRVASVVDLVDRAVVLEPGGGVVADGPPGDVFGAQRRGPRRARGVGAGPAARRAPSRAWPLPGPAAGRRRGGASFRYPATARGCPRPDSTSPSRAGEALAITGANGSGKSTLALAAGRAAAALDRSATVRRREDRRWTRRQPPQSRLWRWRGRDLVRTVGTVFQDPEHQFVTATVRDELAVGPRRAGAAGPAADGSRRRAARPARARPRSPAANPFTLSGGEKRRLSVATAIATAPRVVVADEPTFGQDARTWAELVGLLADLRDDGRAAGRWSPTTRRWSSAVADRTTVIMKAHPSTCLRATFMLTAVRRSGGQP